MSDQTKCHACGHPVKPGEACGVCGNITGPKPKKEKTR